MSDPVLVRYDGNVQIIQLNRPQRKNAINLEMYRLISEALSEGKSRQDVTITVLTGVGDYFSSGNDFGDGSFSVGDTKTTVRANVDVVRNFVSNLIEFPKILIAVVNGHAIGIAVTLLPLCDIIFAVETATFRTPFTSLGISAEGCSTYTFPRTLGKSLAAKMLYFDYKMTAVEAKECGLVSELFNESQMPQIFASIKELTKLPVGSLMATKRMIRSLEGNSLLLANTIEMETLVERFMSEDFMEAMVKMMEQKRKRSKL